MRKHVPSGDRTHDLAPSSNHDPPATHADRRGESATALTADATSATRFAAANGPRTAPKKSATAKVLGLLVHDAERAA